MESYNVIVYYNTTNVSSLCHTWKPCICFDVYILKFSSVFLFSELFPRYVAISNLFLNVNNIFLSQGCKENIFVLFPMW